ncbi:MAG: hypothetical protein ACJAY2_002851 [Pseudomonadales bacterium]|jgi:hypothetical protein
MADVMVSNGDIWNSLRDKHQLQSIPLERVVNWEYLDATLERYWDEILCHN